VSVDASLRRRSPSFDGFSVVIVADRRIASPALRSLVGADTRRSSGVSRVRGEFVEGDLSRRLEVAALDGHVQDLALLGANVRTREQAALPVVDLRQVGKRERQPLAELRGEGVVQEPDLRVVLYQHAPPNRVAGPRLLEQHAVVDVLRRDKRHRLAVVHVGDVRVRDASTLLFGQQAGDPRRVTRPSADRLAVDGLVQEQVVDGRERARVAGYRFERPQFRRRETRVDGLRPEGLVFDEQVDVVVDAGVVGYLEAEVVHLAVNSFCKRSRFRGPSPQRRRRGRSVGPSAGVSAVGLRQHP